MYRQKFGIFVDVEKVLCDVVNRALGLWRMHDA